MLGQLQGIYANQASTSKVTAKAATADHTCPLLLIRLKLMSNFPHVQMVHMSFMEKPEFDYVLKPLGGEKFGMDVNNIPGLSGFIKDQVHAK
jgi:hypothetical protein